MTSERRNVFDCPHCEVENPSAESTCRACSKGLVVYIGPVHLVPRRFGLGPLMLLIAVLAVGFGLLRLAPGLGVPALLILTPAVIRLTAVTSQRAEDGRPMRAEEKCLLFITSVEVMIVTLFSFCITFFLR